MLRGSCCAARRGYASAGGSLDAEPGPVFIKDVDAHYAKARAEGAKIVEELHETMYGERQYGVVHLDGHPRCIHGIRGIRAGGVGRDGGENGMIVF